jgi:HPt (histidine-containing phosphotransfer) domain-containing protein
MTETSLLDRSLLDENAAYGIDDFHELIDMYLTQADETMVGLQKAVGAGEAGEVQALAHKLAGSSAVCGVTGMIEPLRTLEDRGRQCQLAGADQILTTTIERLASCRRLLDEYLQDKASPS